ncbi:MAG: flavodoxin domain-containing protein, partial [Deltaproteobacteria bacterium]
LINRMGGASRVFEAPKGTGAQRFHTILTRLELLPLVFSALSGIYIVLTEFELVSVRVAASESFPMSTAVGVPIAPGDLQGLRDSPLNQLISLQFPMVGDPTDVFTLETQAGITLIDQGTGAVLERVPVTLSQQVYRWLYALHTGVGIAWFGLFLGLAALAVPVISLTGVMIWWKRRRHGAQKIAGNQPAALADVLVLVGSEGGSTWGFARALHAGLSAQGRKVRVIAMNDFRGDFPQVRHALFLSATYGNGQPPENAAKFRLLLADLPKVPAWSYAVLGFGDRAFANFCKFAKDLDIDLENHGWTRSLPSAFINRQSGQAFTSWGVDLGQMMGVSLNLTHQVELPKTEKLRLIDRKIYGENVQAPTAVLRFAVTGKRQRFAAGDVLGIVPPRSTIPRYYSISSADSATEVEICVRKQAGGECSGFLHGLALGDEIDAFVRPNPEFALTKGNRPVIMVSAGTGIAPFIGMIRMNRKKRAFHLFWGGRDPASDFLYERDLAQAKSEARLTSLTPVFSRATGGGYVQGRLRDEAARLADLLKSGASIMVCGGDQMAQAVASEFDAILNALGSSVQQWKAKGQYREDIF